MDFSERGDNEYDDWGSFSRPDRSEESKWKSRRQANGFLGDPSSDTLLAVDEAVDFLADVGDFAAETDSRSRRDE